MICPIGGTSGGIAPGPRPLLRAVAVQPNAWKRVAPLMFMPPGVSTPVRGAFVKKGARVSRFRREDTFKMRLREFLTKRLGRRREREIVVLLRNRRRRGNLLRRDLRYMAVILLDMELRNYALNLAGEKIELQQKRVARRTSKARKGVILEKF